MGSEMFGNCSTFRLVDSCRPTRSCITQQQGNDISEEDVVGEFQIPGLPSDLQISHRNDLTETAPEHCEFWNGLEEQSSQRPLPAPTPDLEEPTITIAIPGQVSVPGQVYEI
ncbi:hypothetical protein h2es_0109 [Rickettsiales endosymbiont of Trichoplax sp. H2]|nr:hypothetical protein [Rickettsiales endosymbiont of Trichoplax sp. H2]